MPTTTQPIVAIDLAKNVCQFHYLGDKEQAVSRRITRAKLLGFFENRPESFVAMDACASAHY